MGKHLRVRVNANQPTNGSRPYQNISTLSPIRPGASLTATNIAQVDAISHSMDNAMWASFTKNLSHGIQFLGSYNWSKSMDLNSLGSQGGYALQDSYNRPQRQRGIGLMRANRRSPRDDNKLEPFFSLSFRSEVEESAVLESRCTFG